MKTNAEIVKHILSTLETANCYIESLYDGMDFSSNVTRARFENEMSKILPTILTEPIQDVLSSSGTKATDIDKVRHATDFSTELMCPLILCTTRDFRSRILLWHSRLLIF